MASASITVAREPSASRRSAWYSPLLRSLILVPVFSGAAIYEAASLSALASSNIWSHLRVGIWILQNHAVPHASLFSQAHSLSWVDLSWGFDLLAGTAYQLLGLVGIPVLLASLQIAVAAALFALARKVGAGFWPAAVLTVVAQICLMPMKPRPSLCSMAAFAIELALLLKWRRAGEVRPLFWLPVLFVLWANCDLHFSYGLALLALFYTVVLIEQAVRSAGVACPHTNSTSVRKLGIALIASTCATLITPYGWHSHSALWRLASNSSADRYFPDLHSLRFRQPQDYLLMLLAMSAFFALGRSRSRDLFLLSLLAISAILSFRVQRDSWVVVVVSVGIIAGVTGQTRMTTAAKDARRREWPSWAGAIALSVAIVAVLLPSGTTLMAKVAMTFPLKACDYVRSNRLSQPLFNAYEWGSFLTWYLPQYPVYIDGRTDMYDDSTYLSYFRLMNAELPIESHEGLAASKTILLPADSPLAEALATLPAFHLAYKDKLAIVLVSEGSN